MAVLDTITWIDENDVEWPWPYQAQGVEGRGAPPSVIESDAWTGDGAVFRSMRYGPREIFIPLTLGLNNCGGSPADEAALRQLARDWVRAIAGSRSGGTLRVATLAGDSREIRCHYSGGMEWVESSTRRFPMGVSLVALDPFWTDIEDSTLSWTSSGSTSFFTIPSAETGSFIPLVNSFVIADEVINNTGDDTSWPIWTITGPTYGQVTMTNVTTGETLSGFFLIDSGETVTIDTRPGYKSVLHSDGTNLFGSLDPGSILFGFQRGLNDLTVELASAEPTTELAASYRRRWLSA